MVLNKMYKIERAKNRMKLLLEIHDLKNAVDQNELERNFFEFLNSL